MLSSQNYNHTEKDKGGKGRVSTKISVMDFKDCTSCKTFSWLADVSSTFKKTSINKSDD